VIDKVGAAAYERLIRPAALRWPEWVLRCRTQGAGAIAALAAEPWSPGRHPTLEALSTRCEALPEFEATWPADYAFQENP
jgi:glutathione S-transferase